MNMLLLTNEDVEQILDMSTCLEALETGYRDLSENNATHRPRSGLIVASAPSQEFSDAHFHFGSMEGASRTIGTFAIRMKSDINYTDNGRLKKYCVEPGTYCGLVMIFSIFNGEPLAIMPDGIIQHMRVGGTAGLGAKYLANPDSSVAGIIGSGGMARTFLWAFKEVLPIETAKVFSPTEANRKSFAVEMTDKLGIDVIAVDNIEELIKGSDVVATCTDAGEAVVHDPGLINEGVYLTDNTPSEWGHNIIEKADVLVRLSWANVQFPEPGTTRVGGEYLYVAGQTDELSRIPQPKTAIPIGVDYWPHLADVISGDFKGRTSTNEVVYFNNHGSQGLQFATVGGRVFQIAKEKGIGKEIPTEWFLQDIRD